MYLDFYGLREMPFNITPDPRFLFLSGQHRDAFDSLVYGIEERKGFLALVGEVGSGKTTVCRAVLSHLPPQVQTALVLNPALTGNQLIAAILKDLGAPSPGRDRLRLLEQLNGYLLDRARKGMNVAVIIDEAQDLTPEVLEEIRLLSNLETDQQKLMQIVLAGQPEFERRLARPELRQLRQRIMVKARLRPMDAEETGVYIAHRMAVAGAPPEVGFDADAVALVHTRARGIPRLVNKLCDRVLLAGYAAGERRVGRSAARRAIRELEDVL